MEPITFTAIVVALSAGVATGIANIGESALVNAYESARPRLSGTSTTIMGLDTYRGSEGATHC